MTDQTPATGTAPGMSTLLMAQDLLSRALDMVRLCQMAAEGERDVCAPIVMGAQVAVDMLEQVEAMLVDYKSGGTA